MRQLRLRDIGGIIVDRLHRHGAGVQPRSGAAPADRGTGPRPHPPPGVRGDVAGAGAADPQEAGHRVDRGVLDGVHRTARAAASCCTAIRWTRRPRPAANRTRAAGGAASAASGAAREQEVPVAKVPRTRRASTRCSRRWPRPTASTRTTSRAETDDRGAADGRAGGRRSSSPTRSGEAVADRRGRGTRGRRSRRRLRRATTTTTRRRGRQRRRRSTTTRSTWITTTTRTTTTIEDRLDGDRRFDDDEDRRLGRGLTTRTARRRGAGAPAWPAPPPRRGAARGPAEPRTERFDPVPRCSRNLEQLSPGPADGRPGPGTRSRTPDPRAHPRVAARPHAKQRKTQRWQRNSHVRDRQDRWQAVQGRRR